MENFGQKRSNSILPKFGNAAKWRKESDKGKRQGKAAIRPLFFFPFSGISVIFMCRHTIVTRSNFYKLQVFRQDFSTISPGFRNFGNAQ